MIEHSKDAAYSPSVTMAEPPKRATSLRGRRARASDETAQGVPHEGDEPFPQQLGGWWAPRKLLGERLVPFVRDALAVSSAGLARRPRKLVALFGGSAMVTLGLYAAGLLCSIMAFGGDVAPAPGRRGLPPGVDGGHRGAHPGATRRAGGSPSSRRSPGWVSTDPWRPAPCWFSLSGTFWVPVLPGGVLAVNA